MIYGYSGSNCDGVQLFGYKFGYGGCRGCRRFDNSHSILIGECPLDLYFEISDGTCEKWKDAYKTSSSIWPGTCVPIDTGYNFMSGWTCQD